MRLFTLTLSTWCLFSLQAAALDDGLMRVAFIAGMTEKCDLKLSSDFRDWIAFLLKDLNDQEMGELPDLSAKLVADEVKAKGFVGACLDARSSFYRDGLLTPRGTD